MTKTTPTLTPKAAAAFALVADLDVVANVRTDLGDVGDLAASILTVGLLNPITVVNRGGRLEVVAGHRRLAAVKRLGWTSVPVVVIPDPDADDDTRRGRLAAQLVENLQRDDLDPLDEARGLADLADVVGSQAEAAKLVGRSRGFVSKRIKLLDLPEVAVDRLRSGALTLETAFELSKIDDPKTAAAIASKFGDVHPETAKAHVSSALRDQERAAAVAATVRKVAKANPSLTVIPFDALPRSARPLDGINGLEVDFDDHRREPCHRLSIGSKWDDPESVRDYCAEPGRHATAGESALKATAADALTRVAEDVAKRQAEREAQHAARAARLAEARAIAASWSDRNTALRTLAAAVLAAAADDPADVVAAYRAVGVEVPDEVDHAGHVALILGDNVKTAQHWRAALAVVAENALNGWLLDRDLSDQLAEPFNRPDGK